MKKLKYLFIFLALLLIISIVSISFKFIGNKNVSTALAEEELQKEEVGEKSPEEKPAGRATVEEGIEKIKEITGIGHGNIEYKGVSEITKEYKYRDNLYEYYVSPDTGNFVGMIAMEELPLKEDAKKINKDEALEIAKNLTGKCFRDFFDYDVEIKIYDYTQEPEEAGPNCFSINFEQKNKEGTYTGYYIDIDINRYGEIVFYCAIEGNYEVAMQKPVIKREEAIDIAYREAEKMVKEIIEAEKKMLEDTVDEKAQAMGWTDEPIPPGDSGVYPDTEPVKPEEFKANLDERDKHKVTAELSVAHNRLEWVVDIDNVEINREWGPMGFSVIIDAITGEVLTRGHSE
jgi:hypothetical protein